ncbi:MAG: DNA polymerase III subunit gamma/tau [Candidatus Coatesbacteria bacterium]|nr:DNA polymerase III subunit gamma/tau [Candidatus Coatesbacteria bacterium]
MTYLILSRKWRPQTFKDLVGQEHISNTLINAIHQSRIASAYLFCGPRGTGKTSTARILAKALNCLSSDHPIPDPCGICQNCIEITEGRSLDVIEIDGASNRGIDDIRKLKEIVNYPPTNSRRKIYIIDEIHMLTKEAFNALLKTLEEPPRYINFIFATTEAQKVIPTIVSRCQRFYFKKIPIKEMANKLNEICIHENIQIDEEAIKLISRKAEGGLRDAESLLDQVASSTSEKITAEIVISVLGLIQNEKIFNLINSIFTRNLLKAKEELDNLAENGISPQIITLNILETIQSIIGQKIGIKSDELTNDFLKIADQVSLTSLLRTAKILTNCLGTINISPQPQLILESTISQIIHFDDGIDLQDILDYLHKGYRPEGPRLPAEEKKIIKENPEITIKNIIQDDLPVSPKISKPKINTKTERIIKPGEEKILWLEFLNTIKKDIRLSVSLDHTHLVSINNKKLHLDIIEFHDKNWLLETGKQKLEQLFSNFMNTDYKIILTEEGIAKKIALQNEENQEKLFKEEEVLKKVMEEFKGKNLQAE